MIGQKNNINTLIQWRCNKSVPRFIIISGDIGSGRLTLAKTIMKMINAIGVIIGNSIDDVRATIENAYTITDTTCYVFRNADDTRNEAKNALLKVVEEPPNNAYFIMTVENIDNMLGTIKSRGTVLKMQPYSRQELESLCNDELLLEYFSTPGQLQIDKKEVKRAEDCADEIIKALIDKSGTKLLKATTKLRAKKAETEKIDCDLFFRIFQQRLFHVVQSRELIINPSILSECKKELSRNTINKKASIECMLIKMLELMKNAEIS